MTVSVQICKNDPEILSILGVTMKGIRPKGKCRKCQDAFTFDSKGGFICPDCLTHPLRYQIDFHYQGIRIRRETTFDGKLLATFADAHALLRQAQNEIDGKTFDPAKWKNKTRIEYEFLRLVNRWYDEKEDFMHQGKLAPSYVPKLKTYITHYFKFFRRMDVREIRTSHIKAFMKVLPTMSTKLEIISLKYQKNIADALEGFFNWLRDEERIIKGKPRFPVIEVPEYDFKTITLETQSIILSYFSDEHKSIFIFLFNQGCRPSEVRALMWDCIDGDVVTYKRTFSGRKLEERTKNKQIRKNLLFPETLAVLPLRPKPTGKVVNIADNLGTQFVFTHGRGKKRPYSQDFLNKIFNETLDRFNEAMREKVLGWIDLNITLYEATKHSFGTHHYQEGVSTDLLQKHFGHSKKESTFRYTKIDAVDGFRRILDIKAQATGKRAVGDDLVTISTGGNKP